MQELSATQQCQHRAVVWCSVHQGSRAASCDCKQLLLLLGGAVTYVAQQQSTAALNRNEQQSILQQQ